jgi:glycosyltransferase involved in cell wall biosynthesis
MAFIGGGIMRKKVLLKGPILTRSGYGEQTRFALRALCSRPDLFEVFVQPLQWGQTSWLAKVDEERNFVDQAIEKTIGYIQNGGQFDLSVQVTIPNEWETIAPVNIGYTAGIETTKVAPIWIQSANDKVNKVIVVSNHSKNVFENTNVLRVDTDSGKEQDYKLQTPVYAVNYPVKTFDDLPSLELDLKPDINFLAVAQFGPRKNIPNTIKWFVEEFQNEEVGLVIKTNIAKNCLMDREALMTDLKNFNKELPDHKCKIYVIHGDMTDEEMHSLYRHPKISALIALPHGEGFGLPIFEAAYSGLPVVATGWSGQLDFLCDEEGKEHFYNVAFDLQPIQENVVWENVLIKESMWAYPREQSAKEKMRQCYNDLTTDSEGSAASESCDYAAVLKERFSPEKLYAQFVDCIIPAAELQEMESEIDGLLSDLL